MRKIVFCLVLFVTVAAACKKDNDEPSPDNTARKKMLSGTWKLTAMAFSPATDWNGDGIATTGDEYGELPCDKDDFITYLADGTWKADIGLVCDYQDPDEDFTGKWALSDSGDTFTDDEAEITDSEGEYDATILQLDEHVFKYHYDNSGETVTITLTR
jgi:hypothetical protein